MATEITEKLIAEINVRSADQRIALVARQIVAALEAGDSHVIDVSGLSCDFGRILVMDVKFNSADSETTPV